MAATAGKPPSGDPYGPVITRNVAVIFVVFAIVVALGFGWIVARSMSGLPPFQLSDQIASTKAG